MLEDRGTPTVTISLVRVQAEKTRPPRALHTPFPLGRPLGEPGDAGFQLAVLRKALALLERTDGPVLLEDFAEDAPGQRDNPAWQAPVLPAGVSFSAELSALLPVWAQARARFGRSIVGLSGQPPQGWAGFAKAVLAGGLPLVPAHPTTALAVRFMCDDIKALYGEAAQAVGPLPSARQVDAWFWRHTAAGALLKALREAAMASGNNALKTVGGRFFVPAPWLAG